MHSFACMCDSICLQLNDTNYVILINDRLSATGRNIINFNHSDDGKVCGDVRGAMRFAHGPICSSDILCGTTHISYIGT